MPGQSTAPPVWRPVARGGYDRVQPVGPAAAAPGVRPEQGRRAGRAEDTTKDLDAGLARAAPGTYTVRQCCQDWLAGGLPGRDAKTVQKNRYVLEPVLGVIGNIRLRDLEVSDVDRALAAVAATRSSSTVAMAYLALTRAVTRAQASNLVVRNVPR